mgnify:FL=1|jgi:hypothetical protein
MCDHLWQRVNDVWVCAKCGFTRLPTGQIMFDKQYPNALKRKRTERKLRDRK